MKTLFVNFYGGPGVGKTTMMASVFAELKWRDVMCEMVPEVAKKYVWSNELHKLQDQESLLKEAEKELFRAYGKVPVILTDSPILNQILYHKDPSDKFIQEILDMHNGMNTLDILLTRKKKFRQEGRIHNLEESKDLDYKIKRILNWTTRSHLVVPGERESIEIASDLILKIIS